MKVDLFELERMQLHGVGCGPQTTLALIARIRELEDALSVFHDNVYEHRVVTVLENGVVLK